MKESEEVELLYIDDEPADVQLPSAIDLAVSETEPGVRGDTASGGGTKPAVLETGARIQVPLFVNIGDRRARRHPLGRVRLACLSARSSPRHMRRTEQRRAAVWALYQSDLLGRAARGDVPARRARGSRARWPSWCASTSPSSTS